MLGSAPFSMSSLLIAILCDVLKLLTLDCVVLALLLLLMLTECCSLGEDCRLWLKCRGDGGLALLAWLLKRVGE